MPPKQAVGTAARTLRTPSSVYELSIRLQSLSSQHQRQRQFHASCRCLAVPSLHAPTTAKSKNVEPGGRTSDGSSKSQKPSDTRSSDVKKRKEIDEQIRPQRGGLAANSIFADEIVKSPEPKAPVPGKETPGPVFARSPDALAQVLDPRPNARRRWQRKMLIREIQKRGRLTKDEKIMRSEREHLARSTFFKTSIKKLAPLARQIAGKTIDEAILQMRFSQKKVAQDVRTHLIEARNQAIVSRGMGIGSIPAVKPLKPSLPTTDPSAIPDPSKGEAEAVYDPTVMTQDTSILPLAESTHNPTLSLKRHIAAPDTQIYVSQAWVNRGPYEKSLEYRARGRVNTLRHPSTGLSLLLKEEKTRVRVKMEKEEKERRQRLGKMLWHPLKDRKIYHQRPFYSW